VATRAAAAGTFGPLHDGHRRLLRTALQYADGGLVVGVTTDALARADRTREVPSFASRRASVAAALDDLDEWGRTVEIGDLREELDIVAEEADIHALVVSPETATELPAVNDRRRERGFEPVEGIVAPYVLADDGERISSTRIARSEIDERGRVLERVQVPSMSNSSGERPASSRTSSETRMGQSTRSARATPSEGRASKTSSERSPPWYCSASSLA